MSEQGGPPGTRARAAAGALFFDEAGRVMIVQPSYKTDREIPGGGVEPGETPYEACVREVGEELGIQPPIGRLLAVDWAPHPGIGDLILFVFDGGVLGADTVRRIVFADDELTGFGFHSVEDVDDLLNERLARRVRAAVTARERGEPAYLEHGRAVPG
ncbi:NUDIX domain-containing protein [Streptosporangium roseum]|uniref:ATP/GTP-binding protein n=1 Tax=Streptosporangium roseum (strain ATCC 12428 / DSM 43021 / JCM 3005 / KCTC 9067 / NCIMB 10171 / NRRL 2505 / NI 9100) TaxID=479432 RepID=D2AXE1_STRRD|nr:NUDIX hydrolase [Streptosporangium roseum]ACZ83121.1 putative ATP/GTP-binding protein [Streptosporangium roseum DSM 43021]